MKRTIFYLIMIGLVVLMVACSDEKEESNSKENDLEPQVTQVEITDDELVEDNMTVAKVNGKEIKGDTYNFIYAQIKVGIHQLGYDSGDLTSLKDLAISILVNQELLKQDAEERNITVAESEIDSEFDSFKSGVDNQFAILAEQPNLTEKSYKEQLHFELIHEKYLDSEVKNVEVTDEEVEETYNNLKEQNDALPELEEIRDRLKNELILQKEQEILQTKVAELEQKAEIETLI